MKRKLTIKIDLIMRYFICSCVLLSEVLILMAGCGGKKDSQTSDLMIYELSGRVASCKDVTYELQINGSDTVKTKIDENMIAYSPDGILSELDGYQLMYDAQGNLIPNQRLDSVVRNEHRQIIRMVYAEEDFEGNKGKAYWTYNEKGMPATYEYYDAFIGDERAYTYDKDNFLIETGFKFYDGEAREYKQNYDYLQFDKYGNWVKRLEKNGDGVICLVERAIVYYSDDIADNVTLSTSQEEIIDSAFEEIITPITPEPEKEVKYAPVHVIEDEEQTIFDVVEQMPEFPGGMSALMKYITTNLQYPAAAKKAGTQGRVIVQFVVERDGTITNAKAVRSVESSMDEEAVRIINTMPKWKPGMQRGKTVRVKFTVPVMFRLE